MRLDVNESGKQQQMDMDIAATGCACELWKDVTVKSMHWGSVKYNPCSWVMQGVEVVFVSRQGEWCEKT